jgi:predicted DNA-binding transcriptional regulator YafY
MNRIDRLNAVLIQLQSKKIVKAHEIASRFNISLRTVYRDIRSLEEAGVPIGAEAGVGYYLSDTYHLPPVMFSPDEAAALLFGEKLVEQMSDDKVRNDFCSALFKIKAILKPKEKDHLEKLHEQIRVFNPSTMSPKFNQLFLNEIQQAMVKYQALQICYESKYARESVCRIIEPIGLCNYSSRWHLFAWCQKRKDYRDFRLDRIVSLTPVEIFFKEKKHPSIEEFLKLNNPLKSDPNISLLVDPSRKKYLEESKYWYGFISEEPYEKGVRMKFSNDELNGFAVWLLSSGCLATIESPEELKGILTSYLEDVYVNYKDIFRQFQGQ